MPHSVSPDSTPNMAQDDSSLPDAPLENGANQDISMDDARDTANRKKVAVTLEGMFDDDDSEEEFSSSAPPMKAEEPSSPDPAPISRSAGFSDPDILKAFYQRLFPFRYMFQWLNHSPTPSSDFANREFAFTLPNEIWIRYQSFPTADLFRKQCLDQKPLRLEIGPVYSTNPRERKTLRKASAFRPISKELVFDIDMTDYDDIRTCCTGASICSQCWSFITMAIKVIDKALREDFGFVHILWVYSGRRGAHAWVCDKRAREMDDMKRKGVAGYLELLKGGDKGGKKVNIRRPMHPHLARSLDVLRESFRSSILIDQDPWASPEKAAHLLSLISDKSLASALQKKWDSAPSRSSSSKWADIDALASSGVSPNLDTKTLQNDKQDIVLEYTYPRLDAEVSKKLNHLLKSPFCIHPGTGRICVPIDPRKVEDFDPLTVPTVTQCLAEIDAWQGDEEAGKSLADWEKTSLKEYIDYFRGFVNAMLKEEVKVKREREEDGMEF